MESTQISDVNMLVNAARARDVIVLPNVLPLSDNNCVAEARRIADLCDKAIKYGFPIIRYTDPPNVPVDLGTAGQEQLKGLPIGFRLR